MAEFLESRENRTFAYEMKFLVPAECAAQVSEFARRRLTADPHASGGDTYRITSLYFDTRQFDVFQRTGSYGRAKYRIRRYDVASTVFLERKLRNHGMVTKRRSLVPVQALERPLDGGPGDWFYRRVAVRAMHPVCRISYERMALVGEAPGGPVRLTMDRDLRAWMVDGARFDGGAGEVEPLQESAILEMKFRFAMPAVFKELLSEFHFTPQPVSKYRLAFEALDMEGSGTVVEAAYA